MRGEGAWRTYRFFQSSSRAVSTPSTGQARTWWPCLHTHTRTSFSNILPRNSTFHSISSTMDIITFWGCINAKTYLRDRSVLPCISCILPYLSDPVPPLYQQGKVTPVGWRCPLRSNSLVGTWTGKLVSARYLPDSKTLKKKDLLKKCSLKKNILRGYHYKCKDKINNYCTTCYKVLNIVFGHGKIILPLN